jgi:hypothetical protein
MSIVKQIVDLCGGQIDIESELGKGTEIKLSLPLDNSPPEAMPEVTQKSEDPIEAVRRRAKGRKVTMQGFGDIGPSDRIQTVALASLKTSIEKYISQWFGLEIVPVGKESDIIISDESFFLHPLVSRSSFRSLIILCSNGARRNISSGLPGIGQNLEFASKPCGPHRLAKALLNCLNAEDATPMTTPNENVSFQGPLWRSGFSK